MNIGLISLFFISASFLVWLFTVKRLSPVILLFPIAIDAYTQIFTGLKWVDVALIIWLFYGILYIKKLGTVTLIWSLLLIAQIFINMIHLINGSFHSGLLKVFITPLHMYFPVLVLVWILENKSFNLHLLWKRFDRIIVPLFIIIGCTSILMSQLAISIKSISGVATLAGFLAVIYPIWFALYSNTLKRTKVFGVGCISFLLLVLSDTRGALLVFIILTTVVIFMRFQGSKLKVYLSLMGAGFLGVSLLLVYIYIPFMLPDGFVSIFDMYKDFVYFQGKNPEGANLSVVTGDLNRLLLWGAALNLWMNHFWLGVGSGQFPFFSGITGEAGKLSPHHAALSIAADGGIVALLAAFSPQIFLLIKMRKGQRYDERLFFHFAWVSIAMSFVFGYAFNFLIIIALYLSRREYMKRLAQYFLAERVQT